MASQCCLSYPNDTDPTYLDFDPAEYTAGPPARRSSSHPTMDGSRVIQDFGVSDADREITLRTGWVEPGTLDDLREKFAVTGQAWKWTDHEGDSYLVFFRDLKADHLRGVEAFEVQMTFDVLEAL